MLGRKGGLSSEEEAATAGVGEGRPQTRLAPEVEAKLTGIERQMAKLTYEKAILFTPDGRPVWESMGTAQRREVTFADDAYDHAQIVRAHGSGEHRRANDPERMAFSSDGILENAIRMDVLESRVVTKSGVYRWIRPPGGWPDVDHVMAAAPGSSRPSTWTAYARR